MSEATGSSVTGCSEVDRQLRDLQPTVVATVGVRIGQLDGPDEYVFGRVTGLAADDDHIFIADGQADVIRAYDWNGGFLFTVASRGAGPGEVRRPCCLAIDRAGNLWVRDTRNARYNAYRMADGGAFLRSVRMVHNSPGLSVAPTFTADNVLIDVGNSRTDEGTSVLTRHFVNVLGEVERRQPIPTPPQDSVPTHTVTTVVDGGVARYLFAQRFGPRRLVAHGPHGDYAHAISSAYQIRWVGTGQVSDTVVTAPIVGHPVTDAERDSTRTVWAEQLRESQWSSSDFPFDIADTKPVLHFLQFDMLGRLWVHLTPDRSGPNIARVHDLEADVVTTVAWPREIDLRFGFILDSVAWGIQVDSLGVQQVVRLTF